MKRDLSFLSGMPGFGPVGTEPTLTLQQATQVRNHGVLIRRVFRCLPRVASQLCRKCHIHVVKWVRWMVIHRRIPRSRVAATPPVAEERS